MAFPKVGESPHRKLDILFMMEEEIDLGSLYTDIRIPLLIGIPRHHWVLVVIRLFENKVYFLNSIKGTGEHKQMKVKTFINGLRLDRIGLMFLEYPNN
ncbi:unnamed protein product [Cuscuta campestris]|uniref:Ubiquitin-like protease family profile domain-containing protein n=1 Tax=Cuscuta campestris TaxID=132261 RepID=A0A484MX95_9ASTE|nr:unnamed protein product [Cuscuta campestris]